MANITIIQGHPDGDSEHLCHALADAYAAGASKGGHSPTRIDVARLDFDLIRSEEDFVHGTPPACIQSAQEAIKASDHLVLIYPLWLGTMPAILKGFLEQVFRYDFAFQPMDNGRFDKKLGGRSARIIVTMGMPAIAYRWYFGAHGLKNLERNILKFAGIRPIRNSLLGMVDKASEEKRSKWLSHMRRMGAKAV